MIKPVDRSLNKTALILEGLKKVNRRVHYHALDVSESSLCQGLAICKTSSMDQHLLLSRASWAPTRTVLDGWYRLQPNFQLLQPG